MKKRIMILMALLTTALAASPALAQKEDNSLIFGITQLGDLDPMSFTNTYQYWFDGLIFDRLVTVDTLDRSVKSQIASDWEIDEEGTGMTFSICDSALFHDGTPVTVEDIVYSVNTATASPYLASYLSNIESAEAVDETTVRINTREYNSMDLASLSYIFIVPEALYSDETVDFSENPVGSGPFTVSDFDTIQGIYSVERNENYWGEEPTLDRITFREFRDPSTMVVALENGEIDLCSVAANDYNTVAANSEIDFVHSDPNIFAYLTMNTQQAPFDNVLVRQAINYAIDRDSVMLVATGGVDAYAESVMNADSWGIDASGAKTYEYDPDKAIELFEEAGVELPLDLGLMRIIASAKDAAEMVQQNLADIGVSIQIEQTEISDWMGGLMTGNYLLGLMGSYDFTAGSIQEVFPSSSIDSMNFARYSNADLDDYINGYYTSRDEAARLENGQKIIEIVQEEVPYAVLYKQGVALGFRKGLQITAKDLFYMNLAGCSWSE